MTIFTDNMDLTQTVLLPYSRQEGNCEVFAEFILHPRGIFYLTEVEFYGSDEKKENGEDEDNRAQFQTQDETDKAQKFSLTKKGRKEREKNLKFLKKSVKSEIKTEERKLRKANRRHDKQQAECISAMLKSLAEEKHLIKKSLQMLKEKKSAPPETDHSTREKSPERGCFGRLFVRTSRS